eukprot:9349032-Pyramimonas_sp.AAC.1
MRAGPSADAGWEARLFSMETHAATSSISPPRGPCHSTLMPPPQYAWISVGTAKASASATRTSERRSGGRDQDGGIDKLAHARENDGDPTWPPTARPE